MTLNKITKNLIPVLLVLAFTGYFTGKTPYYVPGLSPFFSNLAQVEAIVFSEVKAARLAKEQDYENRVRSRICLLYTSPSPRDISGSRMPSSA